MMNHANLYSSAHLIVAAIRILEHRNSSPPSVENICDTLSVSLEQGNLLFRKLEELKIIEVVEGPYGTRLFVRNHVMIEEIPKDSKKSGIEEEIKQFQNTKKNYTKKIESFQAKLAEKQKNLFAELEKKMKKDLSNK
jgi:DNA-binding IscR family transcriptional regulator